MERDGWAGPSSNERQQTQREQDEELMEIILSTPPLALKVEQPLGSSIGRGYSQSSTDALKKSHHENNKEWVRMEAQPGQVVRSFRVLGDSAISFPPANQRKSAPPPAPPSVPYQRQKVPKRNRPSWRDVARTKAKLREMRGNDFVPWEATDSKNVAHDRMTVSNLPRAPLPFDPKTSFELEKENKQARDNSTTNVNITTTKTNNNNNNNKARRAKVSHTATQTQAVKKRSAARAALRAAQPRAPLLESDSSVSRAALVVRRQEAESNCLDILGGRTFYRSLPVSDMVCTASAFASSPVEAGSIDWFCSELAALRDEVRHSIKAIKHALDHRKRAMRERMARHREELILLSAEMLRQACLDQISTKHQHQQRKACAGKGDKKVERAFMGGIAVEKSSNKRAWESLKALDELRQRQLDGKPIKRNRVTGQQASECKRELLNQLHEKQLLKATFDALASHARICVIRNKLCLERCLLIRRQTILPAWGALYVLHKGRQWLRKRCAERQARRQLVITAECFGVWKTACRSNLLDQGKAFAAQEYARSKALWRAFVAWRARVIVVQKYDAMCHVRATQWMRQRTLAKALLCWRACYLGRKVLRIRLCLACMHDEPRPLHSSLRLPLSQTRPGLRANLGRRSVRLRRSLDESMDLVLLQPAVRAVQSVSFGVQEQHSVGTVDRGLAAAESDIFPRWKLYAQRRKKAHDCYLAVGRLLNGHISSSSSSSSSSCPPPPRRPPDSKRESVWEQARAALFKVYRLSKIGRLANKPLRSHVRALASFLAASSLQYYHHHSRPHRIEASDHSLASRCQIEHDLVLCSQLAKVRAPAWFSGWRKTLASRLAHNKLRSRTFAAWQACTAMHRKERRADAFQKSWRLKSVWRALKAHVKRAARCKRLCRVLGDQSVLSRSFSRWRAYTAFWQREARRGAFSAWGRWRRYARARALRRAKVVAFHRRLVTRKVFRRWLRMHKTRALLVRVFTRWEERSAQREFESKNVHVRDFRLLQRCVFAWRLEVAERKEARKERQALAAADLFLRSATLSKTFRAWRVVVAKRWHGPKCWDNM